MKYIALLLVFLMPAVCGASTLVWNANTEADLAGYRVYSSPDSIFATPLLEAETTAPCYALTEAHDGLYFAVTAFDLTGNESELSASIQYVIPEPPDTTPPTIPGTPWISDTMCQVLDGQTITSASTQTSDLDYDGDTDGSDAFIFKQGFGDWIQPDDVAWFSQCTVVTNTDGTCVCNVITEG